MNHLILVRLKEMKPLQSDIKSNELDYKSKSEKNHNFSCVLKTSLRIIFLRNMHTRVLSIEDADKEKSKLFKELSDTNKGEKPIEKLFFLKTVGFLLDAREMVLHSFKSNIFEAKNLDQISTPETTPDPTVFDSLKPRKLQTNKSKHMISPIKLHQHFLEKILNDKKL